MNFQELLVKFFKEEATEEEIGRLKVWLESDVKNRRIFDRENEIFHTLAVQSKVDNLKIEAEWQNLCSRLGMDEAGPGLFAIMKKNSFRILIAAACAATLIAIGAISLWMAGKNDYHRLADSSIVISTNEGEKANIILPDSSRVFMNSASTIEYNGDFNSKDRKLRLRGEAYFDVTTNPDKPFVVQTDQVTITAKGTRFNVLNYEGEDRIESTLEEGKISVAVTGKSEVEAKPGQQVIYSRKLNSLEVRDVSTDVFTSWRENKLRLYNTPFDEALRKISRKYNVNFELTSSQLLNLTYTGTFIDESLDQIMEMLASISPISYKVYYRTKESDNKYLKPKVVIGLRKPRQ